MKIVKAAADCVELTMETPYEIAYETVSSLTNILIRAYTDTGLVGWGVAAPDEPVTGESPIQAYQQVLDVVDPLMRGLDPLRPAYVMSRFNGALDTWPSVKSGVIQSLFDIMGKVAGLPFYKLLGGYRDRIKTSMTIGILGEEETISAAVAYVGEGFSALKLKGGKSLEEDVAKVMKVREAVGQRVALRFDANQGYEPDEAVAFVQKTRTAKLEILEQPTCKSKWEHLGRVTRQVSIPVMADESLLSLKDAFRLAKGGLVDMVNIKLMKVGGVLVARDIAAVAGAAKLPVMVGCMDELALGIAASLGFACGSAHVVYADLDGHIGLKNDPTASAVRLKNGVLYPSPLPGLGYSG